MTANYSSVSPDRIAGSGTGDDRREADKQSSKIARGSENETRARRERGEKGEFRIHTVRMIYDTRYRRGRFVITLIIIVDSAACNRDPAYTRDTMRIKCDRRNEYRFEISRNRGSSLSTVSVNRFNQAGNKNDVSRASARARRIRECMAGINPASANVTIHVCVWKNGAHNYNQNFMGRRMT